MIGKIFEVTKSRFVNHIVYDERLDLVIAALEYGSTFVLLEVLDKYLPYQDIKCQKNIFKIKILTNEGKVGYVFFWEDEFQPAKTS